MVLKIDFFNLVLDSALLPPKTSSWRDVDHAKILVLTQTWLFKARFTLYDFGLSQIKDEFGKISVFGHDS